MSLCHQLSTAACSAIRSGGLALLLLLLGSAAAWAQQAASDEGPILRRIEIKGLDAAQEQIARKALPAAIGEPLTREGLLVFEQNLRQTTLPLENMRVSIPPYEPPGDTHEPTRAPDPYETGVELVLDFHPPPSLAEVEIFPMIPVDPAQLRAVLKVQPGDKYNQEAVAATIKALQQKSIRLGYGGTVVTPHVSNLTTGTIALGFIIKGRQRIRLERVKFKGTGWFWNGYASRLREFFKRLEPEPFNLGTSVTVPLLLRAEGATAAFMRAQGYLHATARLTKTQAGPQGLKVTYSVDRGPRYRIEGHHVTSVRNPDEAYWEPVSEPLEGKPFTVGTLRDFEDNIKLHTQLDGFMAPDIKMAFEPDLERHRIRVNTLIDEGTTSILGRVLVQRKPPKRGYGGTLYHKYISPPLRDDIIRRQFRVPAGTPLNYEVLEDGRNRLERLGILEEIDVDTTATTRTTAIRNIVAKVTDQRTAALGSSAGWAETAGPLGRLSFNEGNLGGGADALGISTNFTNSGMGGELSYLDRYTPLLRRWIAEEREPSLLWSAYSSDRSYGKYAEHREGVGVGLGYLLGEPLGPWSNAWQLEVENISFNPFGLKQSFAEKFNAYLAATLSYRLSYDRRTIVKNRVLRGWLVDSVLQTGMADGPLIRWTNSATYNYPITRKWGWVSSGILGLMPINADDVGISHRFQLGGYDSVRGFQDRGIGPVDARNSELHTGGSTMLAFQNEIHYTINDDFEIPVFVDVGTLNDSPLVPGSPRASAGIGLRFKVPGMDQSAYVFYGKTILSQETDTEQSIHFGFNVKFGRRQ